MSVPREAAVAERYFKEGKGKQMAADPTRLPQPGVWLPLTPSPPLSLLLPIALQPHWSLYCFSTTTVSVSGLLHLLLYFPGLFTPSIHRVHSLLPASWSSFECHLLREAFRAHFHLHLSCPPRLCFSFPQLSSFDMLCILSFFRCLSPSPRMWPLQE